MEEEVGSNSDESYYTQDSDSSICSPSPISQIDTIFDNLRSDTNVTFSDIINEHSNNVEYVFNTLEDHQPENISNSGTTPSIQIPAAIMVPTGIVLYILSLLTFVGNAMVLHAIRTDKRL